ncbi:MAG: zinc-binding dehydrogenase, partial [Alphaproteobacteria bacterium]|nr:zinc-binding dehydrogenase [Alphaproteobacteria bacterium]
RVIDANYVLKIPDAISAEQAAASLHKGMTAEYILNNPFTSVETNFIKPGTNVMLYAAAGGVGHIACQWAKDMGANVIGVVSTEEKAEFAKAHGCAHTILFNKKSNEQDFIRAVMDKTGGEGVPIIYDSVGRDTFGMSLKCLPKSGGGLLVSYGNASGPLPSVNFLEIEGSPAIVRPKLIDYIESLERRRASAHSFLDMVASGKIKIEINQRYSLDNAAQAQRELGNRETTGSSVLTMAPEY